MRVESNWAPYWRPLFGIVVAVLAIAGILATYGAGVLPFGAVFIMGTYYALRPHVEVVAISNHQQQLILTTHRLFSTKIEHYRLQAVEARYEARGGLRIAKYYVLEIYSANERIAVMSPKEGFNSAQLERLYYLLKSFLSSASNRI